MEKLKYQKKKRKKSKRTIKNNSILYRDIKGRRENLSPIFVIGGIYDRKNPFLKTE